MSGMIIQWRNAKGATLDHFIGPETGAKFLRPADERRLIYRVPYRSEQFQWTPADGDEIRVLSTKAAFDGSDDEILWLPFDDEGFEVAADVIIRNWVFACLAPPLRAP